MFPAMSLTRHRVGMREVAFRRVEDDVFERDIHGLGPELYRERLVRLVAQAIEKGGIDGRGLFSDQPRERGALRAVPFARGAEAAEQVNLERRCLGELVRRQLRAALVEIIGDAHRADGMRTRWARVPPCRTRPASSLRAPFAPSRHSGREKAAASAAFLRTCSLSLERIRGGPVMTAVAPIRALRIKNARRSTPSGIFCER